VTVGLQNCWINRLFYLVNPPLAPSLLDSIQSTKPEKKPMQIAVSFWPLVPVATTGYFEDGDSVAGAGETFTSGSIT
jgi:hypothetical protein